MGGRNGRKSPESALIEGLADFPRMRFVGSRRLGDLGRTWCIESVALAFRSNGSSVELLAFNSEGSLRMAYAAHYPVRGMPSASGPLSRRSVTELSGPTPADCC
jgi:hypothetical protein